MYITEYKSPIGKLLLASDGINLTGLWIEGQKYYASTLDECNIIEEVPVLTKVKQWLDYYFEGKNPKVNFPLKFIGSTFRQAVWKELCNIPYGEFVTYGEIAKKLAQEINKTKMLSRAVGGAVGHNPISIIVPCHRVIGANGKLTGYAGGIDKKIKLLELEKANNRVKLI